ncbi:MAG: hypothetical protein RQ753_05815 [Desulfurivibrionaceae bacterium]|nr:hypothetical protein [Desulfurivibrionaceae bacterium]
MAAGTVIDQVGGLIVSNKGSMIGARGAAGDQGMALVAFIRTRVRIMDGFLGVVIKIDGLGMADLAHPDRLGNAGGQIDRAAHPVENLFGAVELDRTAHIPDHPLGVRIGFRRLNLFSQQVAVDHPERDTIPGNSTEIALDRHGEIVGAEIDHFDYFKGAGRGDRVGIPDQDQAAGPIAGTGIPRISGERVIALGAFRGPIDICRIGGVVDIVDMIRQVNIDG